MARASIVVLLWLGCATARETPVLDPELERWIADWDEARRCLVAPAADSMTGVAISMLEGRDCRKALHKLDVRIAAERDPLELWRSAIDRTGWIEGQQSPGTRSILVKEIDARVRALVTLQGRHRVEGRASPSPPTLGAPWRYSHEPQDGRRFDGGRLFAYEWGGKSVLVEEYGRGRWFEVPQPALPSGTWGVRDGWGIDRGTRRIVVRPKPDGTYELEISDDAGKTWRRHAQHARLLRGWQDLATGEVYLLVEDGTHFVHRVTADDPRPVVEETRIWDTELRTSCLRDGRIWALTHAHVTRVRPALEAPLEISGSGKDATLDCLGDQAIVLRRDPEVIERCTGEGCRPVFSPPAGLHGVAALLEDGRWIYAAELGGIVGVWVEGGGERPSVFRLPWYSALEAIVVLKGVPILMSSGMLLALPVPSPRSS